MSVCSLTSCSAKMGKQHMMAKPGKSLRHFEGIKKCSGMKVWVGCRSKRWGHDTFGIFEGTGKQVTQVLVHRLGDGPAALENAKKLAIKLAKLYVDEDMKKAELTERRNAALPAKSNVSAGSSGGVACAPQSCSKVMKKPAAAEKKVALEEEPAEEVQAEAVDWES